MSVHLTEEQQLEQLKKFWDTYGNIIVTCLLVLALCIAGWHWWQQRVANLQTQASSLYETMMQRDSEHNIADVRLFADKLIQQFPRSVYADFARLLVAHQAAEQQKLSEARDYLQQVAKHGKSPQIQQIAALRLARVLLAEAQPQAALDVLANVHDREFIGLVADLRGDAYTALKQFTAAREAYELAIKNTQGQAFAEQFTSMKLQVLPKTNVVAAGGKP